MRLKICRNLVLVNLDHACRSCATGPPETDRAGQIQPHAASPGDLPKLDSILPNSDSTAKHIRPEPDNRVA